MNRWQSVACTAVAALVVGGCAGYLTAQAQQPDDGQEAQEWAQETGIITGGRWEERPTRSQVARMLYRYHQHITERTAGANHQHTAGGLPADDTNTTTTAAGSQAVTTTTAAAVGGSGSEVRLLLVELEYEGPSEPNIWPPQIFTITRMPPRSFWGDDGIVIVDQPYLAAREGCRVRNQCGFGGWGADLVPSRDFEVGYTVYSTRNGIYCQDSTWYSGITAIPCEVRVWDDGQLLMVCRAEGRWNPEIARQADFPASCEIGVR